MNKDLVAIFEYLEREKGIKREIVISAIEESLEAAAKKSVHGASNVTVKINSKSGEIDVFCEKEIVDEVEVSAQEITLEEARELDPDCELGQFIDILVTPKDFGRIAAQKARSVIAQKLRSAERDVIYEEYRHRANEIVSGTVKRFVRGANIIVDLGKVEAFLPMRGYPKTERYNVGDKLIALLLGVEDTENGGAQVVLSRSDPEFVNQLFIQEVPEISDGTVIIEKIVRDPGYRTKIAVSATDRIDPVGACVGMRGMRVKNIVRELNNEKVDIIPFSKDAVELLQNALSPIEIRKISISDEDQVISIVVDDDDFAATVGKRRSNMRLNGELIGYELEVHRMTDYNMTQAFEQNQFASSISTMEDPTLDNPLEKIEGVNQLIFEQLVAEGYGTLRSLLVATTTQLCQIPGISETTAELILKAAKKMRE